MLTRKFFFVRRLLVGVALSTAVVSGGSAEAGTKLFAYVGNPMRFNGTTEAAAGNGADPFTIELYSSGNECLRIAVTAQETDLEATLIAPDGRVWQDDDGNGNLRPLIKAVTSVRGWHILRVSHYAGAAAIADFTAMVSRQASTDLTCSAPTPSSNPLPLQTIKPVAAPGTFLVGPGGTH